MEHKMEIEISKTFSFESSHILPRHPGKCSRLHGHSYKLTVYVKGEVTIKSGFVMDYAELKNRVQPIIDVLDHRHLGTDILALNGVDVVVRGCLFDIYPSAENILVWIADHTPPFWSRLELHETENTQATLTREVYDEYISMREENETIVHDKV